MLRSEEYLRARKRAEAKYTFYVHAAVFAAVMLFLAALNLITSPGSIWFVWPLIGWGFGVVLHGVTVFLLGDKAAVLDAMTEKEMRASGLGGGGDVIAEAKPQE